MNTPRISLLLAAAVTVAIGIAAFKTYLPMLHLMPNPLVGAAAELCAKMATCVAAQARYTGRADRSTVVQYVTFNFRAPSGRAEIDKLRTELAKAAGPGAALKVDYLVNGAAPSASASSGTARTPRHVAGGAKQ